MQPEAKVYAIYDADGSLEGELAYVIGKLSGTRQCSLCDISHGWNPLGKSAWRKAQGVAARIEWLHRDEQPSEMAAFTQGRLPLVLSQDFTGFRIVMDRDDLAACSGDYASFEAAFAKRLEALAEAA